MTTPLTSGRCFNDETLKDRLQQMCEIDNALPGDLKDYDCPVCRNKGFVYKIDGLEEVACRCECMEMRATIWRMKRSGIYKQLDTLTFDKFRILEAWQGHLLNSAKRYAERHDKRCFFIGGQSGAGKTHLCTAICSELLKQGYAVQYVLWESVVREITSRSSNADREERDALMQRLLKSDVIYIDDFLRKPEPSQAERSVAFDVLNQRYIEGKTTIISSEKQLNVLLNLDEAIAGRIKEMAGNDYCLSIANDPAKNYRLRKDA